MSKPRFMMVIAIMLIAAGAGIHIWPHLRNNKNQATLLPDTGGPIESVVLNVNSARRAALRNAELVGRIVSSLPVQTRCLLLTNDRDAFTVVQNRSAERIQFLELPTDRAFTIWTQDPFLVLRDGFGQMRLLVSRRFSRADDRLMVETLSRHFGTSYDQSSLIFEGGNIVSDPSTIFVGGNTIYRNAVDLKISEVEVVRRFEEELGRDVLVVGRVPQPVGHIDLMLTPLGFNRLIVADSAAGAMLAEDDLHQHPDDVTEFERRCEQQFFGHPQIKVLQLAEGGEFHAPQIVGNTTRAIADSRAIANDLDRLASVLSRQGYRVSRMPFLHSLQQNEPTGDEGDQRRSNGPGYPTLTYNNVLVERRGDGDIVYLPQYGWAALDTAAQSAWRELGFDVRLVNGLAVSAMYGGSLRCCVKVIARETYQ